MTAPYWLETSSDLFPDVSLALTEPDGLLAVGGNLSPERLENAYRHGIFPWYSGDQPILWWSPNPRSVLFPEKLHISRSLRKSILKNRFRITLDQAFNDVIKACAEQPRSGQGGTWIMSEMEDAYIELYRLGIAHSAEAWLDDTLVGGLYGVAIGKVFFGESMFSRTTDASKIAFSFLVRQLEEWKFTLIDCQLKTRHLDSLGAVNIPRNEFINILDLYCKEPDVSAPWKLEISTLDIINDQESRSE